MWKPAPIKDAKKEYTLIGNARYILSNLWRWDKRTSLTYLITIPILVVYPFMSILMARLILNAVAEGSPYGELIGYVAAITAAMAVMQYLKSRADSLMWWRSPAYRFKYVSMINQKRMTTDYENLLSAQGARLLARAKDVTAHDGASAQASLSCLINMIAGTAGFFLYGGVISAISPWVAVIVIGTTLVNYLALKKVRDFGFKARSGYAPLDRKLNYIIGRSGDPQNAKDIRLYNMADWFQDMYRVLAYQRLVWHKKAAWVKLGGALVDGLMILLRDGAAYLILIAAFVRGEIAVGDFVFYLSAVAGFSTWLTGLINQANQFLTISNDITDLRSFLDMPDRLNHGPGAPIPSSEAYEITLDHVSYRYADSPEGEDIVKDVSLTIRAGEKLAVVGVNGAGKTTLVSLICGLMKPTKGRILLNGTDINELNAEAYYALFTAVFQNISFLPLSIEENITSGAEADAGRLARCVELAGLIDVVAGLPSGVKTMLIPSVNEGAASLSGGETQKLALARALYKDASIIVLDEPTAALDPIAESEIYRQYGALTDGRTSVYISHRLSSTRFCDRIALLNGGRIEELGSHDELMALGGAYARMFDVQSHYYKLELEKARAF